ncbi:MAG: tetratricopeptide repeat protein [Pseudomonadota bacterium]|nr:tetratricopeptide repeat protein [Pseudomonadota bacterium]
MSFDLLFQQGVRLMREGDAPGAQAAFRATLALAPHLAAAHINLGLLLTREASWAEAEQHYRTALALAPDLVPAYLHLGALLAAQKNFSEAESLYRQALRIDPASPGAWSNLGVLLACTLREQEAEDCYRHAMGLDADYRGAPFNLAYLLLRQGRFEEGWHAFESRDWYARLARHFAYPRWHGEALAGKRLMIGFEGGQGDMIQFCRYANVAKTRGAAHIALVCHPALKRLFARMEAVDQVYGFDEDVPATGCDYWTPPMSFPWLCGTRIDTIPAALPYLHADPVNVARLAPLTAVDGRQLRVGLAWQGNSHFENDSDRSLASLAVLAPLFAVAGVRFFSLQKGVPAPGAPVTDLAPHSADFDDTAALIMGLDLVISVDTAVAHLAGALGKPVWVLLPAYKTDWRWLTVRTDSPWYPGVMRLFRQQLAGDWGDVVSALRDALVHPTRGQI